VVVQLVEALLCKLDLHGFDSQWGDWYFYRLKHPGGTVALGLAGPHTEVRTRAFSWGGGKGSQ
jgi:hypothetical protein